MKRKVSIVLLLTTVMMLLTACSSFTCDICGKEKFGKKYETKVFFEEVEICKDCYNDIQDGVNSLMGN